MADLHENDMVQRTAAYLRCLDDSGNSGVASLVNVNRKETKYKEVIVGEEPSEFEAPLGAIIRILYSYNGTSGLFYKDTNNNITTIKNSLPSSLVVAANGTKISIKSTAGRYGLYVDFLYAL